MVGSTRKSKIGGAVPPGGPLLRRRSVMTLCLSHGQY
jgi:hypothetical protein